MWAGYVYRSDGVKWVFIILAIGLALVCVIAGAAIPKLQTVVKTEPEEEKFLVDPPSESVLNTI